jgi:hypothetical protein
MASGIKKMPACKQGTMTAPVLDRSDSLRSRQNSKTCVAVLGKARQLRADQPNERADEICEP